MAWEKQPVEVTLRNGRRFRIEIDVKKPFFGGTYDRAVRHAIACMPHQGGVWYKNNFINWGAVFSVCRTESLETPVKAEGRTGYGKRD